MLPSVMTTSAPGLFQAFAAQWLRKGQEIAIPRGYRIRPVEHVQAWLAASGITGGPLFRPVLKGARLKAAALTPHSAAQIVKAYAKRAGLDAASFAGHNLRAGFLTSAAESGASIFKVMEFRFL